MKHRKVLWTFTVVVFILVFFVPRKTDFGFLTDKIERILQKSLGFPVQIGRLQMNGLNRVTLHNVAIADPPFFEMAELVIEYDIGEIFNNHLRKISIRLPQLYVDWELLQKIKKQFEPKAGIDTAERELGVSLKKVQARKKTFRVDRLEVQQGVFHYQHEENDYAAQDFELHVEDFTQGGFQNLQTKLTLALGKQGAGTLSYRMKQLDIEKSDFSGLHVDIKNLDLPLVFEVLRTWLPKKIEDGKVSGKMDLSLDAADKATGLRGTWKLPNLNAESSDGSTALADFSSAGEFVSHTDPQFGEIQVDVSGQGSLGQVLSGSFFQDFSGLTFRGSTEVHVSRPKKTLAVQKMNLAFPQWGLRSSGNALVSQIFGERKSLVGEFKIAPMQLADLQNAKGREILSTLVPSLNGLENLRGVLTGQATVKTEFSKKENSMTVKGDLSLATFHVKAKEVHVEEVNLQVPFVFTKEQKMSLTFPQEMRLSWKKLQKGLVNLGPANLRVQLKQNELSLSSPLETTWYEGKVLVPRLHIHDVFHPFQRLETQILVSKVNLYLASQALGVFPFFGWLHVDFPKIRIQDQQVETLGSVKAEVFGGNVTMDHLWAKEIGSANRVVGLDAKFKDINLGLLSQITNFGYILGVLEGRVEGLVLAGGQPTAFDLDFYTVRAPRVDHVVGIEAVRKIAIFAGASSALQFLDQGLYRFIDQYHYEALGARIQLENGKLRMDTHLQRGKKKLILKGRSFPRIDVVYNRGGGEILFESFLSQIDAVKLRLRKEKEK